MTTTLSMPLPSETVETITKQARQAKPGRVLLSVIGGVLFAVGWLTARMFGVIWFGAVWGAIAVREGWREAKGVAPSGPSVEQLLRENQQLRAELRRIS